MIPLSVSAWAEEPELRSETQVLVRPDLLGEPFFGGLETLGGTASIGPARLEGYGDFGFRTGFDQRFGGQLYLLTADGEAGAVRWTLGRQRLSLPTWSRRLDGARVTIEADRVWSVGLAAGVAAQAGLAGSFSGLPLARVDAAFRRGPLLAEVGAWGELADDPVAHADAELGWAPELGKAAPELHGIAAVGGAIGAAPVLERGRVDLSARPTSGLRALGWVEHREALTTTTPLSSDILAVFAPDGSDTVGVGAGWTTAERHRLWASGSVQRWDPAVDGVEAEPLTGVVGELRWEPRCGAERWCLSPGWQGVSGSGGLFHRVGASLGLPLPALVDLVVSGAWVPWVRPHLAWRSSFVAGAKGVVDPGGPLAVEAGCDLFFETEVPDTRAWLALQLRTGGTP